jgi:hypothetical protein
VPGERIGDLACVGYLATKLRTGRRRTTTLQPDVPHSLAGRRHRFVPRRDVLAASTAAVRR